MRDFQKIFHGGVPVIAILRGLEAERAGEVGQALYAAGIRFAEVPLNRPKAWAALETLQAAVGEKMTLGAGTVLQVEDVERLAAMKMQAVVSPNLNTTVVEATRTRGMLSIPGVMTPSEAFQALDAGAQALKLFPSEIIGTKGLKAMKAVLPKSTPLIAVGGVDRVTASYFLEAGAAGLGVGSSLFQPGRSTEEIAARAQHLAAAVKEAMAKP